MKNVSDNKHHILHFHVGQNERVNHHLTPFSNKEDDAELAVVVVAEITI